MPKKRRAAKKPTGISDATRAADDELRALLQSADLKKFDRALAKAIKNPAPQAR